MDKRITLPVGYQLHFPGLTCTVEGEIGRGSNAIVYRGWYQDSSDSNLQHQVLIKELFPYHEAGGIYRDPGDQMICVLPDGEQVMELHRESFQWGNEVHLRMKKMYPGETGVNINTYGYHGTFYTLLDYSGGRTIEEENARARETLTLRRIAQRCMGVLEALSFFHEAGFLHLDISPDNVILLNSGRRERTELIDFNSVVRTYDLATEAPLRLSTKQGFAAPEIRKQDLHSIGTWTDLYAATALFYYCLMGVPLSRMQMSGIAPIQAHSSVHLQDAPETVKAQVHKILAKGLAAAGKRRYQTAQQLLAEFQELISRIDGIGVTHWALWENSAKSVRREISTNPGLAYLMDEELLYPLEVDTQGQTDPSAFLRGNANVVLTGSGGMGKTTMLLRMAWQESQRYRPDRPALYYIPLQDYTAGNPRFIHDRILQKMRFSAEMATYENARHSLDLLLQKPLMTKNGQLPAVCLLLDGYNEILGDTQALQHEISQLSQMEGVNILIASRTDLPEFDFQCWRVKAMAEETVGGILNRNGLLIPQDTRLRPLLSSPLMLTLFIRACLSEGEQLDIDSGEALIHAYLKSMTDKELRSLPEDSPEGWQIRAAVDCVLPVAAALSGTQVMTNGLLLKQLEEVYRNLGSRLLRKQYPEWSGHSGDIRGDANQAEEWFSLMVRDILWRRLGLLVRSADGEYRICHQAFQEVLAPGGQELIQRLQRKKHTQWMSAGAAVLLAFLALLTMLKPPAYDPESAIDLMQATGALVSRMSRQQKLLQNLLNSETPEQDVFDPETYDTIYGFSRVAKELKRDPLVLSGDLAHTYRKKLEKLEGTRFPWNDMGANEGTLLDAVSLFLAQNESYLEYVSVLEHADQEQKYDEYRYCRDTIREILEADIRVTAAYYMLLYRLPGEGMVQWQSTAAGSKYAIAGSLEASLDLQDCITDYADQWREKSLKEIQEILEDALSHRDDLREKLTRDRVYVSNLP